ncbi:protein CLP1-like protein [Hibiscus syriacus]|uniref:Protein CLP1-like protein n=1 Tax=Hibiscus syriacus TaxID=106335 RepID=A0A6A2XM39_HIBSY|nr:protein CLP1-like protein [Hibiscus syriacus]
MGVLFPGEGVVVRRREAGGRVHHHSNSSSWHSDQGYPTYTDKKAELMCLSIAMHPHDIILLRNPSHSIILRNPSRSIFLLRNLSRSIIHLHKIVEVIKEATKEVTEALANGLESSNLIVGIDFTKSNGGQVTRSVDTQRGLLSPQEQKTVDAIVRADGPWDMMKEFDDNIPARAFDNFRDYVKNSPVTKGDRIALSALMEIPSQYKATTSLIFSVVEREIFPRVPLGPPTYDAPSFNSLKPSRSTAFQYGYASFSSPKPPQPTSFKPSVPPYPEDTVPVNSHSPTPCSTYDSQACPIA